MSLLPSRPEASQPDDAEPRVIGVDSDDAEDVISALSSETARKLLAELHEEPAPPSELSDRVDTSLQNTQYHLEKLQAAGAVSVVDTAYSAKGREMEVYAPSDQPLVIFAGNDEKTTGLKAALSRLLGGAGLLALGSVVVQSLYGDTQDAASAPVVPSDGGGDGSGAGGNGDGAGGNGGGNGGDGSGAGGAEDIVTTIERDAGGGDGNGNGAAPTDDDAMDKVTEAPEMTEQVDTTYNEGVETSADVTRTGEFDANETLSNVTVEPSNGTNLSLTNGSETITPDPGPQTTETAVQASEAAAGTIEPGLVFFLGGALILATWLVVWYARQ